MKTIRSIFRRSSVGLIIATALLLLPALSQVLLRAEAQTDEKEVYKPTGREGSITGAINFVGVPPAREKIDVGQDANCVAISRNLRTEYAVVTNGKLANVFVYVMSGGAVNDYRFETPSSAVELEHKGCRYVPHVLGIQTGQTLRIINSDPAMHNTHPSPHLNEDFNRTQPPGATPMEHKFNRAEVFIPVKDNQHPWEKALVSVLAHPFFAVSDVQGQYKIEGLPPGTYRVAALHEWFGEQRAEITVGTTESKTLNFTFKPK